MVINFIYFLCSLVCSVAYGLDNGLVLTPPMGWMTWQRYRCTIDCKNFYDDCLDEDLITRTADKLVDLGLQELGYKYLIIDDCWAEKARNDDGELEPDHTRFPKGLNYLSDYIHSKNLKFGLYFDFGVYTCGHYPGSEFYLKTDATSILNWGVDYVKMDGCYADPNQMNDGYPEFSKLLNRTGRPTVFSCSWPDYQGEGNQANYTYISQFCNLWRNYVDIQDSWASVKSIIEFYATKQNTFVPAAGPGHWNDPDMLIIGDYGLSISQAKVQMAFWCLFSAPLIMSNDLGKIDPEMLKILKNEAAIKVNQDSLGLQGARILKDGSVEVWLKPLSPPKIVANSTTTTTTTKILLLDHAAVIIYNSGDSGSKKLVKLKLRQLGFTRRKGYRALTIFGGDYGKIAPTTSIQSLKDYDILLPDSNVTFLVPPCSVIFFKLHAIDVFNTDTQS